MYNMESLKGKVAIITGASSGIGAATARLFAKHGCKLVLTARRKEMLDQVADECVQLGLRKEEILVVVGDIMKTDDVHNIADQAIHTFDRVDILVNNAGSASLEEDIRNCREAAAEMDRMFTMHVKHPFVLIQRLLPEIIKSKGRIINNASISARSHVSKGFPYNIAKAAQVKMTKCVAMDISRSGARCNSVSPGIIKTPLWHRSSKKTHPLDQLMDGIKPFYASGRCGTAEEVAEVIVFLASDASSYINGADIPIDGGDSLPLALAWNTGSCHPAAKL